MGNGEAGVFACAVGCPRRAVLPVETAELLLAICCLKVALVLQPLQLQPPLQSNLFGCPVLIDVPLLCKLLVCPVLKDVPLLGNLLASCGNGVGLWAFGVEGGLNAGGGLGLVRLWCPSLPPPRPLLRFLGLLLGVCL